jgi:hypothetical protein
MARPSQPKDIPLGVYEIPRDQLDEWDSFDIRVTCADCAHRNGYMCQLLKRTHVPLAIKHCCDDYLPRIRKLPE